jgi:hypothetical protein
MCWNVNPSLLVYYGLSSSMVEHPYMRWEVLGSNPSLATFSAQYYDLILLLEA